MAGLVVLGNPYPQVRPTVIDETPPPRLHLLPGVHPLVFLVEGSRLFEATQDLIEELQRNPETAERDLLDLIPVTNRTRESFALPAPTAISLNVAQTCNLSCSYCYADEGRFGGREAMMSQEIARSSIDQILGSNRGGRVTVGFIGGEPFLNRKLVYWAVEYATNRAREFGVKIGFSVTTNGTLLNPEDLELLRAHTFAVSISLDGGAEANNRERKAFNGKGVFEDAIERLKPFLESPGRARIAARATVTRHDMRILERIVALFNVGFREVGVSPLRTSPAAGLALKQEDWGTLFDEMVRAAEADLEELPQRGNLRFSNLAVALKQIHAGYSKPLPCGSATNYVSVSARGEYFTCHRTVDDPRYALGDVSSGLLAQPRIDFLRARHVDLQEPCRLCWARYLCGGGCHAEVLSAGRSGCDYIRAWLEYCLRTYDRVLRQCPQFFEAEGPK